jgi:Glycosyl hydrolases family 28
MVQHREASVSNFNLTAGKVTVSDHQDLITRELNRRQFVAKAGMAVAATVFAGSSLGCADVTYTFIPCLGPAEAPAPVPGMKYIRASEIGCALDCDLYTGRNKFHGGPATDDGPLINAAMAGASAGNPITLIIDGSALISGLFLPAGGYWSIAGLGCGTGFFVKSGTNNDGIHNGPPDAGVPGDPGPPVPLRGSTVSLSNFTLNGNRGNGHNGNSTTGLSQGSSSTWYIGINLMNLDNIHIENVVVVNTSSYHFRLSNVGNVTVTGCVTESHGPNTDGLHFDGPANDISITHCKFTGDDDAIALNCPEGYSGNISRVTVSDCEFNSSSLMRLLTIVGPGSARFNIETVTVSNCTGSVFTAAFLIGSAVGANPNSVTGLAISDCTLRAPAILEVGANFGNIVLSNVTIIPSGSLQRPGYAFLRTSKFFAGATYVGASLSLHNCAVQRNAGNSVAAAILEYDSVISALEINGYAVQNAGNHDHAVDLITIFAGSIGQLILNAVNSTNIIAPVSPGGFSSIGSVTGSGVLATGWKFPDNIMANNVPYISATTGAPSIKVNGVVEPYLQG